MTHGLGQQFDVDIYNALPSVEDADKAVEPLRAEFLTASARLLISYNLENRFGVALLHKHNECERDEHMIQYRDRLEGEEALVTRATRRRPQDEGAVPIVWSVVDGEYVPLEYTTDPLGRELFGDGGIPSEFLREFAELKRSSPIGDFLGLAVVQREFYDLVEERDIAIELSYPEEKSNVVFVRKRDEVNRIIQTGWSFEGITETTLGCTATIECEKYCRQTCGPQADGSHQKHYNRHKPVTLAHT
jgi:hypothetical protein